MMQVSTAKIEITPSLATNPYLAGYGMDTTPRTATSDVPYAPMRRLLG
jgi:neutral ceramidase